MPNALTREPHVLHTAKDYNAAMALIHALLKKDPPKGSREYRLLELYTLLVEDYEARHYPEPPDPSPQRMVDFMLTQHALTRANLVPYMGGKARVSEFFAGKRQLSIKQLKALRDLFHVSADVFLPAPRASRLTPRARKTA